MYGQILHWWKKVVLFYWCRHKYIIYMQLFTTHVAGYITHIYTVTYDTYEFCWKLMLYVTATVTTFICDVYIVVIFTCTVQLKYCFTTEYNII
jgi:hypothetical protein